MSMYSYPRITAIHTGAAACDIHIICKRNIYVAGNVNVGRTAARKSEKHNNEMKFLPLSKYTQAGFYTRRNVLHNMQLYSSCVLTISIYFFPCAYCPRESSKHSRKCYFIARGVCRAQFFITFYTFLLQRNVAFMVICAFICVFICGMNISVL